MLERLTEWGVTRIFGYSYARFAEMVGQKGIKVARPEEVGPAWDAALSADRPALIEALVDPAVPTLPPHVTVKQAASYAKALLKGDPEAAAIVWQTWKHS